MGGIVSFVLILALISLCYCYSFMFPKENATLSLNSVVNYQPRSKNIGGGGGGQVSESTDFFFN